jgi:DNA-binding NarL/FixJ family response regulator
MGTELLKDLRQGDPHLPTMVQTRSVDPNLHAFAREAGADEGVAKDEGIEEVIDARTAVFISIESQPPSQNE